MDYDNAEKVLKWIDSGKIKFKVKRNVMVSPFGLGLLARGRIDLIKMEDRAKFLKRMHQLHLKVIGVKKKKG